MFVCLISVIPDDFHFAANKIISSKTGVSHQTTKNTYLIQTCRLNNTFV